tara:strand:+ start:2669 stop:2941 length:273 start_codon:yes stop_codon:yes gene_type:complete
MTVKTPHGSFDVRDITFADRRHLHRLELESLSGKEVSMTKYYDLIEWVMEYAWDGIDNAEKVLKKFDDNKIDEIVSAVYQAYKDVDPKKT